MDGSRNLNSNELEKQEVIWDEALLSPYMTEQICESIEAPRRCTVQQVIAEASWTAIH